MLPAGSFKSKRSNSGDESHRSFFVRSRKEAKFCMRPPIRLPSAARAIGEPAGAASVPSPMPIRSVSVVGLDVGDGGVKRGVRDCGGAREKIRANRGSWGAANRHLRGSGNGCGRPQIMVPPVKVKDLVGFAEPIDRVSAVVRLSQLPARGDDFSKIFDEGARVEVELKGVLSRGIGSGARFTSAELAVAVGLIDNDARKARLAGVPLAVCI